LKKKIFKRSVNLCLVIALLFTFTAAPVTAGSPDHAAGPPEHAGSPEHSNSPENKEIPDQAESLNVNENNVDKILELANKGNPAAEKAISEFDTFDEEKVKEAMEYVNNNNNNNNNKNKNEYKFDDGSSVKVYTTIEEKQSDISLDFSVREYNHQHTWEHDLFGVTVIRYTIDVDYVLDLYNDEIWVDDVKDHGWAAPPYEIDTKGVDVLQEEGSEIKVRGHASCSTYYGSTFQRYIYLTIYDKGVWGAVECKVYDCNCPECRF